MKIFNSRKKLSGDRSQAGHRWTMGSQLGAVAVTGLLWLAVALGPIALVVVLWQSSHSSSDPVAGGLTAESQSSQLVAGEFATRVVTVWLSASRGQESLVQAVLPASSSQVLPEVGMTVADAVPVSYVDAGGGVWAVTVAATVTDTRSTARRFFSVPIKVVGQGAAAVSMPAEVPSTALIANPPAVDYSVSVAPDSSVVTTSTEFLTAYLCGVGDVARVVSPQAPIGAVQPARFTSVAVNQVAAHAEIPDHPRDGARIDVLVTASASAGLQQSVLVQYPLTLVARAGRWEVAEVRPAPILATKQPSPSVVPAVSGSSTPTTPSAPPTPK